MTTPPDAAEFDLPHLHQHIHDTRLAIVITHGEQGLHASHVPLLFEPSQGEHGTLHGHLAKANPQSRDLAAGTPVLVVFPGADAYISPSFYPSKAEHGKVVPTWNFTAVHAHGQAELFSDRHGLLALVSRLTDHHERGRAQPWAVSDAPPEYIDGMLKAIVGFALPIQRLKGLRKLGQQRSAADIAGVREGLGASTDVRDHSLAHLMR